MAEDGESVDDVTETDQILPVTEQLHGAPVVGEPANQVAFPDLEQLVDISRALKADGYVMCVDLTAVDHLHAPAVHLPAGVQGARFELVVSLINHGERRRLRLRVQLPGDEPVVPTLFDVWPGTEAMEREVFDMFGITFEGHPDHTRVLMPEDWIGHPLRKDYAVGRIPVQFKGAPTR